jgi:hypothetical protein
LAGLHVQHARLVLDESLVTTIVADIYRLIKMDP